MKNIILLVTLILLWGCASSEPSPEPVLNEKGTSCTHKYDPRSTFVYFGQLKAYQKDMFGEMVFVYEFTLRDGRKTLVTQHNLPNYICKKL
jgi:hypothetical protein